MKALDEAIRGFQLTIEVHRTTSQRGPTKMTKLPFCRDSARNLAIAVELKLGDWMDNFFLALSFCSKALRFERSYFIRQSVSMR